MGQACKSQKSKADSEVPLSPATLTKVQEAFDSFDTDQSKAIDKEEALKHWGKGFGKLSAKEFFKAVDMNNDGSITFEEFRKFWQIVKNSGHSETEICEELERIKKGESWVGFNDLVGLKKNVSSIHNKPKE